MADQAGASDIMSVEERVSNGSGSGVMEMDIVTLVGSELAKFEVPQLLVKGLDIDIPEDDESADLDVHLKQIARIVAGCPRLKELSICMEGVTSGEQWQKVIMAASGIAKLTISGNGNLSIDPPGPAFEAMLEHLTKIKKLYVYIPIPSEILPGLVAIPSLQYVSLGRNAIDPSPSAILTAVTSCFERDSFQAIEVIPLEKVTMDQNEAELLSSLEKVAESKGLHIQIEATGEYFLSRGADFDESIDDESLDSADNSDGSVGSSATDSTCSTASSASDKSSNDDDDQSPVKKTRKK